ncbi:GAP family protein [Solicola sp. PLA-1-18]|uniref:GAP family protein n=1 Tax=Solicola sp. PLA-1-18 TaxID=3380532 RepID=UPI003B7BDCD6
MGIASVAGLVGLALVDSTSIGTLVLPVLILLSPRVHVGRYCVYLATVAGFYAVVGVALVAGAGWLVEVASGLAENRPLRYAQLVVGAAMLAVGVFGDPRRWFGREPEPRPDGTPTRATQWRDRLVGPDASYAAVAGVGLLAALVEVASMLPFLAAVGIITAADLPAVGWVPLVLAYTAVMVLPALVLLGVRLTLGRRLERPLARLSDWLLRQSGNALYWALAIIGILLVQDAASVVGT